MTAHVVVIVPAFNEERTVGQVVRGVRDVLTAAGLEGRVVVVDDGSTDRTAEVARRAGAQVISLGANHGVGQAFRVGLEQALRLGAGYVVNMDADGQFDPASMLALLEPLRKGEADVALGSRFADPRLAPEMPRMKRWGNRWMSRIISHIAGRRFHDVSCGFRAYTRQAALRLNLWGRFTYTQEAILDMVVKGMRIREIPIRVRGVREFGTSRVASNLWRYGCRSLRIILATFRDYWPLQFFGWIGAALTIPGVISWCFLLWHRVRSGSFHPHIWAGFVGATLVAAGALVGLLGITAQMLKRIRLNQEEILFHLRTRSYQGKRAAVAED
ncbi:MAG TPA: glycosyltransferase family 2 protein [Kiritimatiellae bacterium]|nr:glycosyltransferase family 2 protein [Kiritimatiellia bacterium]